MRYLAHIKEKISISKYDLYLGVSKNVGFNQLQAELKIRIANEKISHEIMNKKFKVIS